MVLPSKFTCGLTCYRGAAPPNPKNCSARCLGKCRPEVGCLGGCSGKCLGGCLGGCSGPIFGAKKRRTSTLPSTLPSTFPSAFLSTPPQAGTSPSNSWSTFRVWGFGTSVAGQATRNSKCLLNNPIPLESLLRTLPAF